MTNSKTLKENEEIETYVLPEDAVVGGSWNLPRSYIEGVESINAPYWDFEEAEFTAYIKSISVTDDQNILKVEYWIYRRDHGHCSGYYGFWASGTAMVDVNTHRRWDVE